MVGRVTFKQGKLIFKEGNKEELRSILKINGITPETIKELFKSELNNPCCSEPELELVVLSDTRFAFHCLSCDTWRFRNRLDCSKNPFEQAFDEHIQWLKKQSLLASELKQKYPDYYEAIQELIQSIDELMRAGDLEGFKNALAQIEGYYQECLGLEQNLKLKPELKKDKEEVKEPVSLKRPCIVCKSDSWIRLSKNRISAIQCINCKHIELHVFRR